MEWRDIQAWPLHQLAWVALGELGGEALQADAPRFYRRLRTETPVLRIPGSPHSGIWLISRYEHVRQVLGDARCASDPRWARLDPDRPGVELPDLSPFGRSMLVADPPWHRRLRGLVSPAFTRLNVAKLRAEIECFVDRLLAPAQRTRHLDVAQDLAGPLPALVIGHLMGVPAEAVACLRAASNAFTDGVGLGASGGLFGGRGVGEVLSLLNDLFARRRMAPRDDLPSAMLDVQRKTSALEDAELLSTAALLVISGLETTTGLIGNAVLALAQAPRQLERLRADRSILPSAIEEFLRFDSPLQAIVRIAREPIVLADTTIPAGAVLVALLGAANRDPARFANPDALDLTRPDQGHVAFSAGAHYCLGSSLARLEAEVALLGLLDRFDSWSLDPSGVQRRPSPVVRSLASLPVRV
jgi:cytochrome P450